MSPLAEALSFPHSTNKLQSSSRVDKRLLPAWLAGWYRSEYCGRGVSTCLLNSLSFYYHQFPKLCGFSGINHVASCSPHCQLWFELSQFSSLLSLIHLLSTSNILLLLPPFLLFLPLWVYTLKQNKTKQNNKILYAAFVHTWEEAVVNTYFQSLIFNQEIILSFQMFIINITNRNMHCIKYWNI